MYSLVVIIELYIFWRISKIINDKIIILIVGNIIFLYSIIEKKCPQFLFKCRMFIKEIIEGILSLFMTFIPKYQEEPKTE